MADSKLSSRLERLARAVTEDQRLHRSQENQLKWERKAQRELGNASVVQGVMLLAALVLAVMGIVTPDKWWLLFVALGLGIGGGRQIALARRRDKLVGPGEPQKEKEPATSDRLEQACDRLLAELKDSPPAVRDFLGKPEATVEAIRSASRQLKQRQQQLLETVSPEREAELAAQRKQLEGRLGHLDQETYRRATDMLRLNGELFHQVRSSVERLASEQQILLASLESLRMRVALAKGAGGQGASLTAMKSEVDRLSEELSSITDALEHVQAVAPIEPDPIGADSRTREKS